jgi:hypothetical protein
MNVAFVFSIVLMLLFILAFLTKRRFGVLGLALAAGAMISSLWAVKLTPFVEQAGVTISAPPLLTLVSVSLVLLPAILLLFSGPTYKDLVSRAIGAFLFASLALALLIEPLGSGLVLIGQSREVYDFFETNRVYIVTVGLVVALGDIFFTKTPRRHKSDKH